MRCFLGLALPAAAREALDEAFAPLRSILAGRGCRWVPAENLHLTLRFLGESDRARLDRVTRLAGRVVEGVEAPAIRLAEAGFFPPRGRRRLILWAGLGGDLEALSSLARGLEEAARAAGFPPEHRSFRPHVTVARLDPRHAEALARHPLPFLPAADCTADSLRLFRSVQGPDGVHYPTEARWPFKPPLLPPTLP